MYFKKKQTETQTCSEFFYVPTLLPTPVILPTLQKNKEFSNVNELLIIGKRTIGNVYTL